MIQPRTSLTGSFIRMVPIGLLYASSKIVKMGLPVHIIDMRISPSTWKRDLGAAVNKNTLIVGISVMSGLPVLEGLKISRYIKGRYPWIHVVWGGPHPTFSPDDISKEPSVDFIIRGYGSEPFYQLVLNLTGDPKAQALEEIKGLSFKNSGGNVRHNETSNVFEFVHYKDIPYQLIREYSHYRHIDTNDNVFPMYSVMGCPYRCAFCSSPAQYAKMEKKWLPYKLEDILGHIKMLKERYGATFIYFIDDDSFVDLRHVEAVIDAINRSGLKVKLGFRGVRVNEISRMSGDFLKKLADAGTDTLHIGVESGCNRLLSLMKKDITAELSIEVNRKLSRQPGIRVLYNFIVGFPTETLEETKMTRDLILQLVKDNPSCCVLPLNKPRPLPGTELYNLALQHGYVPPSSLEEWGEYDVESSDYNPEWLTKEHNKFIRMMFLCMYFIDDKIFKFSKGMSLRFLLLKTLASLYKPIAVFRFRNGFYRFLIEDRIYNIAKRIV